MTAAMFWGCFATLITLAAGVPLLGFLREKKVGKAISAEGPQSHMSKAGTPTMGGLLILFGAIVTGLAGALPRDSDIWLPLAVAAIIGAVGFYDDLGTLVDRETREAHGRTGMILKLVSFAGVGLAAGWILYGVIDAPRLLVPHYGEHDIGPVYILIAAGVIIATTSAEGVTDGIDMLAGSTNAVAFTAYGAIALMQDQDALAVFCFGMTGALVGFLWFNAYPARLFMGDTGSLPLGATLAVVALMTGWWLLLPLVGIVFAAELLSDVIQIGSYRLRGKRVFRMAPFHIHFEQLGFHETQVAVRFLVVGIAGALAAVGLAAWD